MSGTEKKRLFTLEGCDSCEDLLKQEEIQALLKKGEMLWLHCNPEGTDQEKRNCEIALALNELIDGFPTIINEKGEREY